MRKPTLDLEALRTLVTGVELDSFAKAASQLNRSTSAVSVHIKKLEEQTGKKILMKSGRGLIPTPFGEQLLTYARQLLAINDEAFVSFSEYEMSGKVSVGLQEDFGEKLLSNALATFSRAFPNIEIEIHVGRNRELIEGVRTEKLDLAWVWSDGSTKANWVEHVGEFPMCWVVSKLHRELIDKQQPLANGPLLKDSTGGSKPLPLILFERPCLFREAVIGQLDTEHIPWRQIMSSRSLAGIWSAVGTGLGITVRTEVGMPDNLMRLDNTLPELPILSVCAIASQTSPSESVMALHKMLKDTLLGLYPR